MLAGRLSFAYEACVKYIRVKTEEITRAEVHVRKHRQKNYMRSGAHQERFSRSHMTEPYFRLQT